MVTRVYLVRHGATVLSAEDRFAGDTDVLLSDEGRLQAAKLSDRLDNDPITAIFASPMKRTIETAEIVAAPHHLSVTPRSGLREISHGRWEGQTRAEVEKLYPQEYVRWQEDPYSFAPEGGECGLQVTARALPELLSIVEQNWGCTVLVVSHKATIRLLISAILGFEPRSYRDTLDQSPASLNILEFRTMTRARLALYNDISHYASTASQTPGPAQNRLSPWWGK